MLSKPELAILFDLLDQANDHLACQGCNDYDLSQFMNADEINQFIKEFHEHNGDPENYEPTNSTWFMDYCALWASETQTQGTFQL